MSRKLMLDYNTWLTNMGEHLLVLLGLSWSWSYGSWIYNYLCNQVPITTNIVSSNPAQARCTTLSDKVCQCLATGQRFSPGTPVSSSNKTDRHDAIEILLKVALNTITLTLLVLERSTLWFSTGPPVSSINKTDRHDITEILLKVALNTIKQTQKHKNLT